MRPVLVFVYPFPSGPLKVGGIQVGTAGLTPHEGGARWLDPSGCQPSIRGAVLGHRRDITLR